MEAAGNFEAPAIRQALRNQRFDAPGGHVRIDPENQHTWKTMRLILAPGLRLLGINSLLGFASCHPSPLVKASSDTLRQTMLHNYIRKLQLTVGFMAPRRGFILLRQIRLSGGTRQQRRFTPLALRESADVCCSR